MRDWRVYALAVGFGLALLLVAWRNLGDERLTDPYRHLSVERTPRAQERDATWRTDPSPTVTPTPTPGPPRFSSLLTWRGSFVTATATPTPTATPTATPEPTWTPVPYVAPVEPETPSESPPVASGGDWVSIVCSYGWSCEEALNVIHHESRGDMWAVNPSSGACGLWQHYPCIHYGDNWAQTEAAWLKYIACGGGSFYCAWYRWW